VPGPGQKRVPWHAVNTNIARRFKLDLPFAEELSIGASVRPRKTTGYSAITPPPRNRIRLHMLGTALPSVRVSCHLIGRCRLKP